MHVGLIADVEIRNSDKYPAVNRLTDLPGAGGLALCCERRRPARYGRPTIQLGGRSMPNNDAVYGTRKDGDMSGENIVHQSRFDTCDRFTGAAR
jgi:hypothetical protein